jgi:hypothetical protein
MKTMRIAVLLAGALALGACDKSGTDVTLAPVVPLAYTRFINAVPDTGRTDWHFIDQVEYSPLMVAMQYRDFSPYQGTAPGARKLRIFPTSTDINVTQQFLIDATVDLVAGKYYSIIHTGFSRTGATPADHLLVIEDVLPTAVPTTNFATRMVHLGAGLAAADVYATTTTTAALPATRLFTNVAYESASAYDATRPLGPMAFRVANTGTTTVTASALAPAGAAADNVNNLTAIGGTTIGSSIFTGYYFPRSVAGSQAPQTAAFTAPAIVYIVDKHPRP